MARWTEPPSEVSQSTGAYLRACVVGCVSGSRPESLPLVISFRFDSRRQTFVVVLLKAPRAVVQASAGQSRRLRDEGGISLSHYESLMFMAASGGVRRKRELFLPRWNQARE